MKKFLMAVAVLCMGTVAFAGPNAGGTIFAHDANLLVANTNGDISVCGQGLVPATCADADLEIDGADDANQAVFTVYAAFVDPSAPRLMGIAWGVYYDDSNVVIAGGGMCGDFELNDTAWPAPNTGSSVTWNTVQQSYLVPVYYFYAYTYGAPGTFQTGPHPTQGGFFGDDTVPAILDPIAGYGTLGFDMMGTPACPIPVEEGACCAEDGSCTITGPNDCLPPSIFHPEFPVCDPNPCPQPPVLGACCDMATGDCTITEELNCQGTWLGEGTVCDPNPCEPVPANETSWGSIKANYR